MSPHPLCKLSAISTHRLVRASSSLDWIWLLPCRQKVLHVPLSLFKHVAFTCAPWQGRSSATNLKLHYWTQNPVPAVLHRAQTHEHTVLRVSHWGGGLHTDPAPSRPSNTALQAADWDGPKSRAVKLLELNSSSNHVEKQAWQPRSRSTAWFHQTETSQSVEFSV